jgi:hypothetical protein
MAGRTGRNGVSQKAQYASYDPIKNRRIKLERLSKQQPNNKDIDVALKNVHARGPRVPNEKFGWIDRTATLAGFNSHKKEDQGGLYDNITGPADARARAQMSSFCRKVENQHQHDVNFKPRKKK